MSPHPALGVTYASLGALGVQGGIDVARTADQLGYRSFWTAETTGPEAFSLLGAAGAAAPSLDLGTGVLALQLRTPPLVAHGGRHAAGAAPRPRHPPRRRHLVAGRGRPAGTGRPTATGRSPRLASIVTLLRECLSGESVSFEGDFYEVQSVPARRPARRAAPEDRDRRAQRGDARAGRRARRRRAAQLPAGRRTSRGRSSRCARAATRPDLRLRARRRVRPRGRHRRRPPRPVLLRRRRRLRPQLRRGPATATRSPPIRERHAAGDREGALAAVSATRWSTASTSWATPTTCAPPCRPTSTPASTCRCSCRCRGAPTGWRRRRIAARCAAAATDA